MNSTKIEARTNIQFMLKLRRKNEVTDGLHKAYGDNFPKKSEVYHWVTHFKKGPDDVDNEAHSSRQPTSFIRKQYLALIDDDLTAETPQTSQLVQLKILAKKLKWCRFYCLGAKTVVPSQLQTKADLSMEIWNK